MNLLPYLETAALFDFSPHAGAAASTLMRARALPSHAAFDVRVDLKGKIDHVLAGMPEHYGAFLRRWTERKISVIGPAAS